jgi:multiple RNA-binding domain-containing protein 1
VTDVQLKYTSAGKFRKFGFVGFQTEEEAQAALDFFHNSFYNTSKLCVEFCAELGGKLSY